MFFIIALPSDYQPKLLLQSRLTTLAPTKIWQDNEVGCVTLRKPQNRFNGLHISKQAASIGEMVKTIESSHRADQASETLMKIERQGSSEQERSDCLDVSYEFPGESSRCAPVLNSYRRNFHSRRRIGDSLLTVSKNAFACLV